MAIPVPSSVKQYAKEDIQSMLKTFNSKYPDQSASLLDTQYEVDNSGEVEDQFTVYVDAIVGFSEGGKQKKTTITLEYVVDGEDVYVSFDDIDDLAKSLHDRMQDSAVSASVKAATIMAAGEDEEDNWDDEPDPDLLEEDDSVEDALDDMADDIEDMQDSIDEVKPDDPSIVPDNNIEGHYIAECEMCGGIFISAVIESDTPVESITGTCPLCEKHSQQYLKWVVRAVE